MSADRRLRGFATRPPSGVRRWVAASIARRVVVTVLAVCAMTVVTLDVTSYVAFRYVLRTRITENLKDHAHTAALQLQQGVNHAVDATRALAATSLVANALVDSTGRDAYLLPFLREHNVGSVSGVEVVLCDFAGRPIASNLRELPTRLPDAPEVWSAIHASRPGATLVRTHGQPVLVLGFPIVFPSTGHQEGALIASIDVGELFAQATRARDADMEARLLLGDELLVRSAPVTMGPRAIEVAPTIQLVAPLDGWTVRLAMAQDGSAFALLHWLGLAHAAVGALLLLAVSMAARRGARRLTDRITRLADGARRVSDGTATTLDTEAGSHDEVDVVAAAFNQVLRELHAAQATLEDKVRARTSELQARERELERSREALTLAVEGSRLGSWHWDVATGTLSYNDLWPALLGYAPGEIGPRFEEWVRLVHPDDLEPLRRDVVAHVKGRLSGLDVQYRMRARDGAWRWIHTRGRVVERSRDGRAVRAAGTHADVSWRRAAEDALRDAADANARLAEDLRVSEERLRSALASGKHVEWDLDVPRGELVTGRSWYEVIAANPGDSSIDGWLELLHPDDREATRAAIEACAEGRTETYEAQYRVQGRDGRWRTIQSRGRAVTRDARGRALRVTGTRTDVTELRDLHERLLAATRLASVGTLAAGVAHEINNPLTYVLANLASIDEELSGAVAVDRASLRTLVGESRHGAERIAGIVKAMRTLGGPERPEEAHDVDVAAEMRAALQMARNQIVSRARLEVAIADDLPKARARTNELGRVFLNLLVNAAQAIPDGDPEHHRVHVDVRRERAAIVVEVSDTGGGIPTDVRERIFDAFFTTKPVGVGTGLGLTIAMSIVSAAGGTMEVQSEVGHGATFRVRLPCSRTSLPEQALAPDEVPPSPGARRSVLVIDDDPIVGRSFARMLQPENDVTWLPSAEAALQRVGSGERWDAIICDLIMDGIGGIGFHAALAASDPALLRRVAFATGGAFGERATKFVTENALVLVPKPVDRPELLRVVEQLATAA